MLVVWNILIRRLRWRSHSSFTFIIYSDRSTTKQKFCVAEIVWWLGFADVTLIFGEKQRPPEISLCRQLTIIPSSSIRGLCLNHTVQKDSRGVLGTSFRFGSTSEILENIQYGGSRVLKTDSQRSRFIAREAWFTVLLTTFAFIVKFEEFLVLYSRAILL